MAKTRVVNKHEKFDVLIDRSTKWGNPYSHKDGTAARFKVDTREESVEFFRAFLLHTAEGRRLLDEARKELKGRTLGCHCKPASCHGDVYAEALDTESKFVIWSREAQGVKTWGWSLLHRWGESKGWACDKSDFPYSTKEEAKDAVAKFRKVVESAKVVVRKENG